MEAKGHCMLQLPDEESPLDDFYDFSAAKAKSAENATRRVVGVNDGGELVMSDGKVIGHRTHKKEYSQNIRPEDTRACVVIPKMFARYRALCAPGYGKACIKHKLEFDPQMNTYKNRVCTSRKATL